MLIRKAQHEDIQNMMIIIKQAQAYFKEQGIDQWQDGYPNEIQLANDIEKGNSYVILNQGIIGTMYFAHEEDPNYPGIKGQDWLRCHGAGLLRRCIRSRSRSDRQ